jgi:hypothetical protein
MVGLFFGFKWCGRSSFLAMEQGESDVFPVDESGLEFSDESVCFSFVLDQAFNCASGLVKGLYARKVCDGVLSISSECLKFVLGVLDGVIVLEQLVVGTNEFRVVLGEVIQSFLQDAEFWVFVFRRGGGREAVVFFTKLVIGGF